MILHSVAWISTFPDIRIRVKRIDSNSPKLDVGIGPKSHQFSDALALPHPHDEPNDELPPQMA